MIDLRGPGSICSPGIANLPFMRSRLLRPLLVFEFLVAIEVWLSFWSQVGGQYHLDLMFWPWKFGLTVAAAWLSTALTADLFRNSGIVSRRAIFYSALLVFVMVTAGVVTYYYHMNEPADDDNNNSDTPAMVTGMTRPRPACQITRRGRLLPIPSVCQPDS